jgi:hypothetical protein
MTYRPIIKGIRLVPFGQLQLRLKSVDFLPPLQRSSLLRRKVDCHGQITLEMYRTDTVVVYCGL